MSPDELALRQTVIEQPRDERPRLVYADWLEENHRPERAEFIRLQVAGEAEDGPRREAMDRRAAELWEAHGEAWQKELPAIDGIDWVAPWRRGFAEAIAVAGAIPFLHGARAVFAAAPIRRVAVGGLRTDTGVSVLFSPLLENVEELDFRYSEIGNMGVQFLLASPHVARLKRLDLTGNGLSDHALFALSEKVDALPELEELIVAVNYVRDAGADALARARGLQRLRSVDMSGNRVTDVGLAQLRARFPDVQFRLMLG